MAYEILGKTIYELQDFLSEGGFPKYRAKQLMDYIYKRHITNIDEMVQLPKSLRDLLIKKANITMPTILSKQEAPDGKTIKLLIELDDKSQVETVLMRQYYGNSVCVSSQVGCAMGCIFCASTQGGLFRNLHAHEIIGQVLLFSSLLKDDIHSVVVMGAGEPLQNYDNVLWALRFLHEKESFFIGYRRMTISTCGLIKGILRLSKENIPITLALSLHAPNDSIRNYLMPISKEYKLQDVIDAVMTYYQKTDRRITFEYILIEGINDSAKHAEELAELLKHCHGIVNLIPVNGNEHINLRKPSLKQIGLFVEKLEKRGLVVTVRKEMGATIQAACGQLKATYKKL